MKIFPQARFSVAYTWECPTMKCSLFSIKASKVLFSFFQITFCFTHLLQILPILVKCSFNSLNEKAFQKKTMSHIFKYRFPGQIAWKSIILLPKDGLETVFWLKQTKKCANHSEVGGFMLSPTKSYPFGRADKVEIVLLNK